MRKLTNPIEQSFGVTSTNQGAGDPEQTPRIQRVHSFEQTLQGQVGLYQSPTVRTRMPSKSALSLAKSIHIK